jgi:hypothetical protein
VPRVEVEFEIVEREAIGVELLGLVTSRQVVYDAGRVILA